MPGRERCCVGEWVCRSANGITGRANSCTPLGEPGLDPGRAIDAVEAWFGERQRRPLFQVWDGCSAEVTDALDERGYGFGEGADVLVRPIGAERPVADVEIDEAHRGQFARLELTPRLEELALSSLPAFVASIDGGANKGIVSSGVGILDGDALGIFSMRTEPAHRGRGKAASVLSGLLAQGSACGANVAWLQVMPSNEPAGRLYQTFGFERAHGYHYRTARSD